MVLRIPRGARKQGQVRSKHSHVPHLGLTGRDREEFALHGMADIVTLTHQNVCKDGFNLTDAADSGDLPAQIAHPNFSLRHLAVFLDLPAPWDAVEHAKQALRVGSMLTNHRGYLDVLFFAERPHYTHLLLQPVHGAGFADRQRPQRSRIFR
jgi:tRNA A58 N-methylase Trm61